MKRWAGKTAVVTGASQGLGAAIAVRLADEGMRVVGLARRAHLIDELHSDVQGQGSIHSRQCDLADADAVASTFDWVDATFGGVDVIVNNAGVFAAGHISDIANQQITDAQLNSMVNVNIRAMILCTRRAISSMKKRRFSGHVINICSMAGHYVPFWELCNIASSMKHAVCAFSTALLNELAHLGSGIRVTSIAPSVMASPMTNDSNGSMPKLLPRDVADAVAYALGTPPIVNINEIFISSVGEKRL